MHLQEKVQAELDNVLGPDGRPTMQDKPSLPYTEVRSHKREPSKLNDACSGDIDGGAEDEQHRANRAGPRGDKVKL